MTQERLTPTQAWLKRLKADPFDTSPNEVTLKVQSEDLFQRRMAIDVQAIVKRKRIWVSHYNVRGSMRKRKAAIPPMRIVSLRSIPVYQTITRSQPYPTIVDKLNP